MGKGDEITNCVCCNRELREEDRALFVEEEVGRIFCSEECILNFFSPEIERLEADYKRQVSDSDLNEAESEKLAHLRGSTLGDPDEIWRELKVNGDYYYTMISEYSYKKKPIWSVCISLFLKGEPSFLFMSLVTKNPALVDEYRKGERVEWMKQQKNGGKPKDAEESLQDDEGGTASLAPTFTDDEKFRSQVTRHRKKTDIPASEFEAYHYCLDDTLKHPDEVWSWVNNSGHKGKVFHFIKHYPKETPSFWCVIVARETEDREQLEILEVYPTNDPAWLEHFRFGSQDIGESTTTQSSGRVLH